MGRLDFLPDVGNKSPERSEGIRGNFVVVDNHTESLLECGEYRNDPHGIKFGYRSEKRTFSGQAPQAPTKAKSVIKQEPYFVFQVHNVLDKIQGMASPGVLGLRASGGYQLCIQRNTAC